MRLLLLLLLLLLARLLVLRGDPDSGYTCCCCIDGRCGRAVLLCQAALQQMLHCRRGCSACRGTDWGR